MKGINSRGLKTLLFSILTLMGMSLFAQTDTTFNTCSGVFTDPEGAGNYFPNMDTTWTFCPDLDGSGGNAIAFSFVLDEFGLGEGDTLFVYDGLDTSADILMELTGAGAEADFGVLPSPGNLTGCLTFVFQSDADSNTVGPGWLANISCQLFCQPIIPTIVADPPVTPSDTGWVDICQGTTINFSATAEYPLQGGYYYPQSDETSLFTWAFGDGSTETGTNVSHTFPFEGGFIVYLTVSNLIMDGNDTLLYCENTQLSIVKVRVSTTPNFSGTMSFDEPLCITATTELIGVATPVSADFGASGLTAGETFLPDGSGVSYQTDVVITAFAPNQTLDNMSDLLGICLNMEHSYIGDLNISITCPDGTTVTLKSYPGGGGTFLGEPIDDDANLDPGIGYDYCWSPNPEYSDMVSEIANFPVTLPAGSYASEEPLDDLIGCPLNGTWTITVQDNLFSDNGYIFYWGLSLDPSISPFYEIFTPTFVDMYWLPDPTIIEVISPDSVVILGTIENPIDYTFYVMDDFGCSYDTTISLEVLPPPLLFQADSACANVEVEVGASGSWEGGIWNVVYIENDTAIVTISDTLAIDPMISSTGPGLVKLIFDDEYCRTQDTLSLEFYPLPTVVVTGNDIVCWGDTLFLYSTVTGPVDSYEWNTFDYDPDISNATSYIVGDATNTYGVEVSGFCGTASDYNLIYSRACSVETPNIFTPNNDTQNDLFQILYIEFFPNSPFIVYNRWGKKVYETDNFTNAEGWDGRDSNGKELPDGVYFYTLILNDAYKRYDTQDQYVKGSVTITRVRVR